MISHILKFAVSRKLSKRVGYYCSLLPYSSYKNNARCFLWQVKAKRCWQQHCKDCGTTGRTSMSSKVQKYTDINENNPLTPSSIVLDCLCWFWPRLFTCLIALLCHLCRGSSMRRFLFLDDHYGIKLYQSDLLACHWIPTSSAVLFGHKDVCGGAVLVVARLPQLCSVVAASECINLRLIAKSAINYPYVNNLIWAQHAQDKTKRGGAA